MVYNPRTTSLKELEEERNLWIKSRKKFGWDFKQSLKDLIPELENTVREKIIPNYWIEYTSYWDVISKIKIKDKVQMIEKLITITLFFNKNDERYWYITPLFTSEEKNQKTRKYEIWKFSINNRSDIAKAIVKKLEEIIEEF
jgi:hypothetical protein